MGALNDLSSNIYLVQILFFAFFWTLFYVGRSDLRKKILFSSLFSLPLGFSEIFFVPEYWNPRFPIIKIFREDLYAESFLYSFFVTGVGASIYQALFNKPLFKIHVMSAKILVLAPILFFMHLLFPTVNVIYFCIFGMSIVALLLMSAERTLCLPMIASGSFFFAFALTIILVLIHFFPESFPASFNSEDLSGILILGKIPIEEALFYFGLGSLWCILYELIGGSRLRRGLHWFYD